MTASVQPADLSPDARLHEIAAILATGVLRMRRATTTGGSFDPPESPETCLEVPLEAVLTVSTLVNGPRELETRSESWN